MGKRGGIFVHPSRSETERGRRQRRPLDAVLGVHNAGAKHRLWRSVAEGARSIRASVDGVAPSTALRAVPLPHFVGEDLRDYGCGPS